MHKKFYTTVMTWYAKNKRDQLPWRTDTSFYRVHVSEIMLQQTQVDRVIPFFNTWVGEFPNYEALAEAPIHKVYELWKGLGYNSRAKRLWESAQILQGLSKKELRSALEQQKVPGIGPYTKSALEAFVFNEKVLLIETNVRRVYIHHFFKDRTQVSDKEVLGELAKTLKYVEDPRSWYYALMDYGSTLPKILKRNPNTKSKHYVKQSKFEGSLRQLRAKILFMVSSRGAKGVSLQKIYDEFNQEDRDFIHEALSALKKDKLISENKGVIRVQ